MILLTDLHKCLDLLEEKESCLLAWGDTGGVFTRDEVLDLLYQAVPNQDSEELLSELEERAMIIRPPNVENQLYFRTRMGESTNLFRNLRQWFHGKTLEQTRTLVSDFRFLRRPRSYPQRELLPEQLITQWRETLSLEDIEESAIRALLQPTDEFRLAGFQSRATERIATACAHHRTKKSLATGTIVCAGTGSGKTLAFYLPAMSSLVSELCVNSKPRVRILAIYPRKELLKDQFMETWGQARKLDGLMKGRIDRKIRIGALFGDTPMDLNGAKNTANKVKKNLPFDLLRCPNTRCNGRMEWSIASLDQGKEEITCSNCDHTVPSEEVGISRKSLQQSPPDILFTTTEMLNQHLSNNYQNHLFGVGFTQGPTLVLLDEVHTYGGNAGAQTAYLLRRWMQRSMCRPHFVGLSATLADAEHFFSDLIGAQKKHVQLIEPKPEEMVDEGAEYLLALKGDPVSQSALLSTTIQSSMLMRRMLDNRSAISEGTWGTKTFVFTDDLDVNNRLYHQLSDAEGWKTSYKRLEPDHAPLASLRGSNNFGIAIDPIEKIQLGQDWRAAQDIGHNLSENDRARTARTSSQDSGVDSEADIIVATASLEVGFNDPGVGAVIQHKAPRDVSSFLQRKGRAGRSRTMRPWMLVVLSEFGRDRVAFQRYEDLIDPEIKRQSLPLKNSHILKMQAAMATLDWLSTKLGKVAIWTVLNSPQNKSHQVTQLLSLIEKLIIPGDAQDSFVQYLKYALWIDDDTLQRILWSPPRSLMMEFLPTLRRNLISDWREEGQTWKALRKNRSPMPEYIPDALFSELNIPNMHIALQRGKDNWTDWQKLPFHQALREFAPGRISKRYAINSDFDADWLVPMDFRPNPGQNESFNFEIQDAFGSTAIMESQVAVECGQLLPVFRPREIHTKTIDRTLRLMEKSNSRLDWHAYFGISEQTPVYQPPRGCWDSNLSDVTFCTHQHLNPVEVVRYSTGAQASLGFKSGKKSHVKFIWTKQGEAIAVGTRQWVDGMRLRFTINNEDIQGLLQDPSVLPGLRTVYFKHLVESLPDFENDPFKAGWVSECYLAALADELEKTEKEPLSVQAATKTLASEQGVEVLKAIPQSLFQASDPLGEHKDQELQIALAELFSNALLLQELNVCADAFWQQPEALTGFKDWVKILLGNTLTAATQQSLCVLFPDIDERAVIADSQWQEDHLTVWLSESEPGGSGIISRLSQSYFDDPVKVLSTLAHTLKPGDYEQIDYDLFELLDLAHTNPELANALQGVRFAHNHAARREANSALHKVLQVLGFVLSHSFLTVLHSRVLRPGSSASTDQQLFNLLQQWRQLETNSGIEWPLNITAHHLANKASQPSTESAELFQKFCKNQSLLWPRGYSIRQSELHYYSPFMGSNSLTDRLLGERFFEDFCPQVPITDITWMSELHEALCNAGRADVRINRDRLEVVSKVITEIHLEPIDHLGLFLYPRVSSIHRDKGAVVLRIDLAETLQ